MDIDEKYEIQIDKEKEGSRLDAALVNGMEGFSRNYIQKLIEEGNVELEGKPLTQKNYRVREGQILTVCVPEPELLTVEPENIALDIVYEDDDILIINKPKGLVVHPGPGNYNGTLVNALMYHCDKLSSINGVIRPGIVHRIDKDTSGLLMVAKNNKAHNSLAEQLKNHTIKREYRAIVYNSFKEDHGTVDKPIGRDPRNRLRMAVTDQNSKRAVTHYRVIERMGSFCHISCSLETGRTHQIRVHMAYINHPLLGDLLYGPNKKIHGVDTQMLHAKTIGFNHPSTGEYCEFESELPEYFKQMLKKLGGMALERSELQIN